MRRGLGEFSMVTASSAMGASTILRYAVNWASCVRVDWRAASSARLPSSVAGAIVLQVIGMPSSSTSVNFSTSACLGKFQLSRASLHQYIYNIANSKNFEVMAKKAGSSANKAPDGRIASRTIVLDNGAHTIKAGFSSPSDAAEPNPQLDCHIVANCIARSQRDKRTYIGPELLDECWDFGELAFRRPVERGFVVNWESEKAIWERCLLDERSPLRVRQCVFLLCYRLYV